MQLENDTQSPEPNGPSLRQDFRRLTRERLESAALALFRKQGFRATTIQQIAKAAGTTHTTFYQHFKGKSDLARVLLDHAEPEIEAACRRLDAIANPTWRDLRGWVNDYAATWLRIHEVLEAFYEASVSDPEVAAGIIPSVYELTGMMTGLLNRFEAGEPRKRAHSKLVMLILLLERALFLVHSQKLEPASSSMLDDFTDMFWDTLFAELTGERSDTRRLSRT